MVSPCLEFLENLICSYKTDKNENHQKYRLVGTWIKEILNVELKTFYPSPREAKADIFIESPKAALIIEFKTFKSGEFNIEYLKKGCKKVLLLFGDGKINIANGKPKNRAGDGIGQIKVYFYKTPSVSHKPVYSTLTNGRIWVFFKFNRQNLGKINHCEILDAFDISNPEDCYNFIGFIKNLFEGKEVKRYYNLEII